MINNDDINYMWYLEKHREEMLWQKQGFLRTLFAPVYREEMNKSLMKNIIVK